MALRGEEPQMNILDCMEGYGPQQFVVCQEPSVVLTAFIPYTTPPLGRSAAA